MNTFAKNLLPKVQKMRDESATMCVDMVLTDGTVMYSKEQGYAHLKLYDDLLNTVKRLVDTAEVDQEHPQP